jgi:hypothetical protein
MQKSPSHVNQEKALAKGHSLERKVLDWMANENTGMSSLAMAYCAFGEELKCKATPSDPADFNRCLNLVHIIPEIREHFPKIAQLSPEWRVFITNWDRLEKSFLNEAGLNFSKRSSAPITNQLLRDLRARKAS